MMMMVVTQMLPRCTTKHTGTSASAPMAAAIIALTLQVIIIAIITIIIAGG